VPVLRKPELDEVDSDDFVNTASTTTFHSSRRFQRTEPGFRLDPPICPRQRAGRKMDVEGGSPLLKGKKKKIHWGRYLGSYPFGQVASSYRRQIKQRKRNSNSEVTNETSKWKAGAWSTL
jgi:hypothetical protein